MNDGVVDLEQNFKLADLEKRLGQVEARLDQVFKLGQLVLSVAGAALGVDLIPLVA